MGKVVWTVSKRVSVIVLLGLLSVSIAVASGVIIASDSLAGLHFAVGNYHAKKGDVVDAITDFQNAIAENPSYAEAHHNLGVLYAKQDRVQEAEEAMRDAIDANSDYGAAHYSLALILYGGEQRDEAIAHLERVIELEPENAHAYFDLAVMKVERFREKESRGEGVSVDDLNDLREGALHYQRASQLKSDLPHAAENARIVENVLNEYLSLIA